MFKYIISILIIYLFFGFLLFFFQRRIIFNISGKPKKPAEYGLYNIEELKIITDDNIELLCWYSKALNNKPILVYFHGNSFDIGERAYRIEKYINYGWGVLLVSWRGFSGNKGIPTETNLYLDAKSIIKWIDKKKLNKKNDIVLYGESLGTGVVIEMATRYSFKSVILEAPFTSITDLAQKKYKIYPAKFLVLDKFDNFSKIGKITSPILIISGKKDEIVPHSHSLKLYNKANKPKDCLFIDEAMHNNLYDFGIEKKVIEFNNNK
jgi:hypothetical protein